MAVVDLVLQKKGGVGKSVCASLLCQAMMEAKVQFIGVDTDPSNQSLAAYKELPVKWLNLISAETGVDEIDKRLFDSLVSSICGMEKPDSHVVIDVGASNFWTLIFYLQATFALDVLMDLGHEVRLHVVIAGGDIVDTCGCLMELAGWFPKVGLVPWLNPYNAPIYVRADEKDEHSEKVYFMDFLVSREFGQRYLAVVEIPDRCRHSLFRADLQRHFPKFVTFKTAIASPANHIMVRQRLKMFWDETRAAISAAQLF